MFYAHLDKEKGIFQSVEEHSGKTAEYCAKFCLPFCCNNLGYALGLSHDLGKFSDAFQRRLLGGQKCDHSTFGGQIFACGAKGGDPYQPLMNEIFALIDYGHHGGLMDVIDRTGNNYLFERNAKQLDEASLVTARAAELIAELEKLNKSGVLVDEFKAFVDKTGKVFNKTNANECYMKFTLIIKLLFSALVDADRVDTIEFSRGKPSKNTRVEWQKLTQAVDDYKKTLPVTHLSAIRNEIYSDAATAGAGEIGFYKMEVQTGGGKALSSLKFAFEHAAKHNLDRVIIVLPFLSIIEQNAEVIAKVLRHGGIDESIITQCHSNLTYDKDDEHYYLTDNFDSQIVITTMTQFLESVYGGGANKIRRFHNYANSVIIFDEIQMLPSKTITMANALFKFIVNSMNSTIVMCSATQPLLDNVDILGNTALPPSRSMCQKSYNELKRAKIIDNTTLAEQSISDVLPLINDEISRAKSVLIVVNTKKHAKEIFELVGGDFEKFYLTTNMCPSHRLDVINKIKSNIAGNVKTVCVSTQLIEAGVDLDFEVVFRDLAGLDSIIQSAGRCNREGSLADENGEKVMGRTHVINLKLSASGLQEITFGRDKSYSTLSIAKKNGYALDSKEAIEEFYSKFLYGKESSGATQFLVKPYNLYDLYTTNAACFEANRQLYPQKHTTLLQSFATAGDNYKLIPDETIGVLAPYKEGKDMIDRLKRGEEIDLKQAQKFLISVYRNKIDQVAVQDDKSGIYYLFEGLYDEQVGLTDINYNL